MAVEVLEVENMNRNDFLLTCSIRETNVEDNINTIRNAIYDGAEAFMVHLEN